MVEPGDRPGPRRLPESIARAGGGDAEQGRGSTPCRSNHGLSPDTADTSPEPDVQIVAVDPADPGARTCIARYYAELDRRFDAGFDPGESLPADDDDLIPPRGVFLLARLDGRPVGCGAVKGLGEGVGSVKRMWVDGSMRGLRLGRRILDALEEHARSLGLTTLRLETNRFLPEAVRLYERAGYCRVDPFNDDPYADFWFEKEIG